MPRIVGEFVAAILTVLALFMGYAHATDDQSCITEEIAITQANLGPPVAILQGHTLDVFNGNYLKTGNTPPDFDKLDVFGKADNPNVFVVGFKNGCATNYAIIGRELYNALTQE